MNVLIHIATGFGIAVAVTNTGKIKSKKEIIITSALGLFVATVSHGLLDYTPHCYPINSKVDFIGGLLLLILLTFFCVKRFRLIMFCCLIGSVLPDIIDLLPSILNGQLGFELPVYDKIFPWHQREFSGSMYTSDCFVSNVNIGLILLSVIGILILRKIDLMGFYNKQSDDFI